MAVAPKLIILRGNSGSGKSTVAKKLRETSTRKLAIVGQDMVRRDILSEKEIDDGANIALISQIVGFALSQNYNVILEGILKFQRYGAMLKDVVSLCPDSYIYYFDVSFEETLRRHTTKPNAHEFGVKEMQEWYSPRDLTGFHQEKIISEQFSLEQIVMMIQKDTGL